MTTYEGPDKLEIETWLYDVLSACGNDEDEHEVIFEMLCAYIEDKEKEAGLQDDVPAADDDDVDALIYGMPPPRTRSVSSTTPVRGKAVKSGYYVIRALDMFERVLGRMPWRSEGAQRECDEVTSAETTADDGDEMIESERATDADASDESQLWAESPRYTTRAPVGMTHGPSESAERDPDDEDEWPSEGRAYSTDEDYYDASSASEDRPDPQRRLWKRSRNEPIPSTQPDFEGLGETWESDSDECIESE